MRIDLNKKIRYRFLPEMQEHVMAGLMPGCFQDPYSNLITRLVAVDSYWPLLMSRWWWDEINTN